MLSAMIGHDGEQIGTNSPSAPSAANAPSSVNSAPNVNACSMPPAQ